MQADLHAAGSPDCRRCAVVLMTNLEDAGLTALARKIADIALQRTDTRMR